jgi:hypothetical protein
MIGEYLERYLEHRVNQCILFLELFLCILGSNAVLTKKEKELMLNFK